MISKETLEFLKDLKKNNDREWFTANKTTFQKLEKEHKAFTNELVAALAKTDSIDKIQHFRIYRDVRFSKDKSPYKTNLGVALGRTKPLLRGGYYLHIEPGGSFVAGGFWEPNAEDLNRIRKEFEMDDTEIRKIISEKKFVDTFGTLKGDELKTAPKGFEKEHKAIDLIRKKQYIVTKNFTDKEVLDKDFKNKVVETFIAMRPYFDYMSEVLGTNLNGESIY